MIDNNDVVSRLDATYVAPIVPEFESEKEAFLSKVYEDYLKSLRFPADTRRIIGVPLPDTYRIENGKPTIDYVYVVMPGTLSPMRNLNPEFALLTLGSLAGLKTIDKTAGVLYNALGNTGKEVAKSMIAGELANLVSKMATDKTIGLHVRSAVSPVVPEVISKHTPEIVKETVSELFNPFYFGYKTPTFLDLLVYHSTAPHKAGIIPTAALLYLLNFGKPKINVNIPLNVGWGPRQTRAVLHASFSPLTKFETYFPELWGHIAEGLNPFGIWFSDKNITGIPRKSPKKRLKAARARAEFLTRPYLIDGELTLDKPIVTIGDVPDRTAVEYAAEQAGADGVIFNNIYDNGFDLNTSIKSFKEPIITGITRRPRIAYYGPTMGKSTFVKNGNSELFSDFDRTLNVELWKIRTALSEQLGIDPRDFGTNRVPREIANSPLYLQALNEYTASIIDAVSEWSINPDNIGRTLLTSNKYILDPRNKIYLSNTPVVPDFNTFLTRNQARGFKETPELALAWWNSIVEQPGVLIDNRYLSEILNDGNIAQSNLQSALKNLGISTMDAAMETLGIFNPAQSREQALQGLRQLRLFYGSKAYLQRVLEAYPQWSVAQVNRFIQNRINQTDLAIQKLIVNRSARDIGSLGQTSIVTTQSLHYPIGLEVAADSPDPLLTGIHEGLHFTSSGGRNPVRGLFFNVYEDPDAVAIANHNQSILPRLTKSWYKKYTETSDLNALKKEYHDYLKFYYPHLTDAQIEEAFQKAVIKEGTYYNLENEIRSVGLSELIKAISKGEVVNPNDYAEVLRWLNRIKSNGTISAKLNKLINDYRPDLAEWAKYLTKALSIGSIPIITTKVSDE